MISWLDLVLSGSTLDLWMKFSGLHEVQWALSIEPHLVTGFQFASVEIEGYHTENNPTHLPHTLLMDRAFIWWYLFTPLISKSWENANKLHKWAALTSD